MTLLRSRVTPDDIHIGKIITSWLLRIPNRVAVDALLHLLEALKYRQCGEELKKLFYMFDDLEDFGKPQYREARRTLFRAHIMGLIVRTRQPGLQDWLEKVAMDPEIGDEKAILMTNLDRFLPAARALEICREQLPKMPAYACKVIGRRGTHEDIAVIDKLRSELSTTIIGYKVTMKRLLETRNKIEKRLTSP